MILGVTFHILQSDAYSMQRILVYSRYSPDFHLKAPQ